MIPDERGAIVTVNLPPRPGPGPRRRLTPAHVAKLIDERLYDPRLSLGEFVERCRAAAEAGVAAVVCQPSRAALAAHLLSGKPVAVAAAPAVPAALVDPAALGHLLAGTDALLQDGAREIGVHAPPNIPSQPQRATVETSAPIQ